jgi:hypothetical protein
MICDTDKGKHYARLSKGNGQSKGLGTFLNEWCDGKND